MSDASPLTASELGADVADANQRCSYYVRETPLLRSAEVLEAAGLDLVAIKCEPLQRTGSVKLRGAVNALLLASNPTPPRRSSRASAALTDNAMRRGSLAALAALAAAREKREHPGGRVEPPGPTARHAVVDGDPDFAHAVAQAASAVEDGWTVTVAVPSASDVHKFARASASGATLCVGRGTTTVLEANTLNPGSTLLVEGGGAAAAAGHGAVALELLDQWRQQFGYAPDAVVVPGGSPSVVAGIAAGLKAVSPAIRVLVATESRDGASTVQCNSLLSNAFAASVDDYICISPSEVKAALRFTIEEAKLLIDREAAAAIAAVLRGGKPLGGAVRVAVVATGGNITMEEAMK